MENCLWMDFEFCMMDPYKIVIAGRISTSYHNCDIEIYFEQIHFISALFNWQTDTSKPFIQLCTGNEEADINTKYLVQEGNYILK